MIGSIDDKDWQEHQGVEGRVPKDETDVVDLEYMGVPPRTMSLELLFDGFEANESIEPVLYKLQPLASLRDEQSTDP